MQIYIDQSGKVEYTRQDTVLAYSNGERKSIFIAAQEKREVQHVFREAGKPGVFAFKTFAILIYLLVREDLSHIDAIRIDNEYIGNEWLIKQFLLETMKRHGIVFDKRAIEFWHVGKKHKAHIRALSVFQEKFPPDIVVTSREILPFII